MKQKALLSDFGRKSKYEQNVIREYFRGFGYSITPMGSLISDEVKVGSIDISPVVASATEAFPVQVQPWRSQVHSDEVTPVGHLFYGGAFPNIWKHSEYTKVDYQDVDSDSASDSSMLDDDHSGTFSASSDCAPIPKKIASKFRDRAAPAVCFYVPSNYIRMFPTIYAGLFAAFRSADPNSLKMDYFRASSWTFVRSADRNVLCGHSEGDEHYGALLINDSDVFTFVHTPYLSFAELVDVPFNEWLKYAHDRRDTWPYNLISIGTSVPRIVQSDIMCYQASDIGVQTDFDFTIVQERVIVKDGNMLLGTDDAQELSHKRRIVTKPQTGPTLNVQTRSQMARSDTKTSVPGIME